MKTRESTFEAVEASIIAAKAKEKEYGSSSSSGGGRPKKELEMKSLSAGVKNEPLSESTMLLYSSARLTRETIEIGKWPER